MRNIKVHEFDSVRIETIIFSFNNLSIKYLIHLSTFSNLFNGTISLLEGLKLNYQLNVITNGFEVVQHHKIKNSGLANYFKNIITAEKVGYKKPNPIIFEYALDQTKTTPENSLMIGDSLEADILGA